MHYEVVFVDYFLIETKEGSGLSAKEWFNDEAIDVCA